MQSAKRFGLIFVLLLIAASMVSRGYWLSALLAIWMMYLVSIYGRRPLPRIIEKRKPQAFYALALLLVVLALAGV